MTKRTGPKVLLFDIETAPIIGYVWQLWDQNVALNQIVSDWHVLSWSAKWLGETKVMYEDQRAAKDIEDDRKILKGIWDLLDEADILITQNGKAFDVKKLNARFVLAGMKPPSPSKHIDTLEIAKRHFGFTSNKLEYMTSKLCVKYKKLQHKKFLGFELWKACLGGNLSAWKEMEKYNKHDVLSLEELYTKLMPWDNTINFNLWSDGDDVKCSCGSVRFERRGYSVTTAGKFHRYHCLECGAWTRGRENQFSKTKRKSLRVSAYK
jgi:DNA polymerase elongation subunit (family B)